MRAADRSDWTEWCELVNHRLERGDRILADIDGRDRVLARIDYDPFDDEIEIVLCETEQTRPVLIERPCQVRVPDEEDVFSIVVVSGSDEIRLTVLSPGVNSRTNHLPDPAFPPELKGAYFGG